MDNCPAATAAGSKSSNILLQKGRRRKKYTIVLRESSKRSVYKYFEFFLIGWVYVLAKKNLVRFEPQDWMVNWIQPRSVHIAEIVCDSKMKF